MKQFFALNQRNRQPELMDQPGLDPTEHAAALRGLARVNWFSGSTGILWRPLHRLALANAGKPLRILDLATGSGDIPIRLWRRFRRAKLPVEIAGADLSAKALEEARKRAESAGASVQFFPLDAVHDPLPDDFDVITCSLFLHHLENEEAVDLLRRMGQSARQMVLVNDLVRSRIGYLLAFASSRVLSRSPVVHFDGPCSVAAAFTTDEARQMAHRAGLEGARVDWRWPWRYLLQWQRGR